MIHIAAPKNVAQATELLERHAVLDGQIAALEGRRSRMIARSNAAVDAKMIPLLEERAAIAAKIEPWWKKAGRKLLIGKAKSIELGGCNVGSRLGAEKLAHKFDDDDKAVEALRATRHRNQTTRTRYTLDRAATLKLLQAKGAIATALRTLGFSIDQDETFFIKTVKQGGTVGS